MERRYIILANWKMNPETEKEALTLARAYKNLDVPKGIEFGALVPLPYARPIAKLWGRNKMLLGLQNINSEKSGAFTGEVSFAMLKPWTPKLVIVGHSERRAIGETDAEVNQKVLRALKENVTPIICVGEKVRDDHGFFLRTVEDSLKACLASVPKSAYPSIIIAYEPVWAISSNGGREMLPAECHEMMIFIRKVIADMLGGNKNMPRVIYGGSVNELNSREYLESGADGLLPGHASLDPKKMQKLFNSLAPIQK
jgi:triosephosphate isomerase